MSVEQGGPTYTSTGAWRGLEQFLKGMDLNTWMTL